MNIAAVVKDSTADGPGTRVVLFLSHSSVKTITVDEVSEIFQCSTHLFGITFSGSDPFDQALECTRFAIEVKHLNPDYTVWVYTKYKFEEILQQNNYEYNLLLGVTDVLVDGPFVESLKSDKFSFKISTNQRVVNVKQSIVSNRVVEVKF